MKKLIYAIIIIFTLSSTPSHAGFTSSKGDKVLVGLLLGALGVGGALLFEAEFSKAKKINPLLKIGDFIVQNPKWKNQSEDFLRYKLSEAKTEKEYIFYQRLADDLKMSDVPPFEPENTGKFVSDGFSKHNDIYGSKLENPENDNVYPWVLENPQTGEKIDTRLEFPFESPKDWSEYLLLKSNSQELAKNLQNAGQSKPDHSAAHHIVPATMKGAKNAVKILNDYGINVNDAENGVWLPQKGVDKNGNASTAVGLVHSGKHPNVYAVWVNTLIQNTPVYPNDKAQSKKNLEKTLDGIRQKLINAQQNGKTWYTITR